MQTNVYQPIVHTYHHHFRQRFAYVKGEKGLSEFVGNKNTQKNPGKALLPFKHTYAQSR
jgi:hypothetical protein